MTFLAQRLSAHVPCYFCPAVKWIVREVIDHLLHPLTIHCHGKYSALTIDYAIMVIAASVFLSAVTVSSGSGLGAVAVLAGTFYMFSSMLKSDTYGRKRREFDQIIDVCAQGILVELKTLEKKYGNIYECWVPSANFYNKVVWIMKDGIDIPPNNPFLWAAVRSNMNIDVIKYVLENGPKIDDFGQYSDCGTGNTILHEACEECDSDEVIMLIANANPKLIDLLNKENKTPIDIARSKKRQKRVDDLTRLSPTHFRE